MIYFIHIHKNAGTTFKAILRNNYGLNAIQVSLPNPDEELTAEQYESVFRVNRHMKSLTSHKIRYPCPVARGDVKYVAFLRDPLQRMLSHYYYLQQITGPEHYSRCGSFAGFYRELRRRDVPRYINGQVRYLAKDANLESAKEVVRNLVLAGVAERFNESMLILRKRMLPEELDIRYKKVNVGRVRSKKQRVREAELDSPSFLEIFQEDNRLDYELYRYVNEILDRAIDHYGGCFNEDLSRYEEAISTYKFPVFKKKAVTLADRARNGYQRYLRGRGF